MEHIKHRYHYRRPTKEEDKAYKGRVEWIMEQYTQFQVEPGNWAERVEPELTEITTTLREHAYKLSVDRAGVLHKANRDIEAMEAERDRILAEYDARMPSDENTEAGPDVEDVPTDEKPGKDKPGKLPEI